MRKKLEWLGDKSSGELLCEFHEVTTPLIAGDEYLNANGQNLWGVIPIDTRQTKDMQTHFSTPTPMQRDSFKTLDDVADQLMAQIESLAQLQCVNVNDLSQQVVAKLAHKADDVDRGPVTSTPATRTFCDARPREKQTAATNSCTFESVV